MAQIVHGNRGAGFEAANFFGSEVRWSSIFAGVVVALVTHALLSLLGLAIGLTAVDPAAPGFEGIGIGSGIWMVGSAIIATFVGGWVASLLANIPFQFDGVLHGILTWGILMILTIFLIGAGLGNLIGGAFNLASSAVTGASMGATQEGGLATLQERAQQVAPGQQPLREVTPEQQRQAVNTASQISWWAFAAALLSLIAGAIGGLVGFKQHTRKIEQATTV